MCMKIIIVKGALKPKHVDVNFVLHTYTHTCTLRVQSQAALCVNGFFKKLFLV